MQTWQTTIQNPKNNQTRRFYSDTMTPGEAVQRALDHLEDVTPTGELSPVYHVLLVAVPASTR